MSNIWGVLEHLLECIGVCFMWIAALILYGHLFFVLVTGTWAILSVLWDMASSLFI